MIKETVFAGIVVITLTGAFMAVWLKNIFYNALALILCLFGVAGLFIYLNSEFLAVIEVIIYIGAIAVAIIFAIMLSSPGFRQSEPRNAAKTLRSILIGGLLFLVVRQAIRLSHWPQISLEGDYSIQGIGRTLLTTHVLAFEAVSLVLLAAIIGALLLSEKSKERKTG